MTLLLSLILTAAIGQDLAPICARIRGQVVIPQACHVIDFAPIDLYDRDRQTDQPQPSTKGQSGEIIVDCTKAGTYTLETIAFDADHIEDGTIDIDTGASVLWPTDNAKDRIQTEHSFEMVFLAGRNIVTFTHIETTGFAIDFAWIKEDSAPAQPVGILAIEVVDQDDESLVYCRTWTDESGRWECNAAAAAEHRGVERIVGRLVPIGEVGPPIEPPPIEPPPVEPPPVEPPEQSNMCPREDFLSTVDCIRYCEALWIHSKLNSCKTNCLDGDWCEETPCEACCGDERRENAKDDRRI